jgi:ribosome-associated heat shock protein Hsp15
LGKTRAIARTIAAGGHMRANGRRIDRAHQKIVVADILTIPLGNTSRVIALTRFWNGAARQAKHKAVIECLTRRAVPP